MFVILNIRGDYIGKKLIELLPSTMGEQIKMARLRRNLSVELVAERANISRAALWNIENEVRPLLSVIM
jgi:DNA-binding XRE family transcriptional regulator